MEKVKNTNPNQVMEKTEYKQTLRALEGKLTQLQQKVREAGLPIIIVFEGWSASGKGTYISRLVNPLDPRHFDVRTTGKLTEDKQMRPFLWSFWTLLPAKGQISILDKSWHRLQLPVTREAWGLSENELDSFYNDVNAFERQLTDDGYLIIKLFLHISKDEQYRRIKKLALDPTTAWRINDQDWEQNKRYDINLDHIENLMTMTATEQNPWHVIEAEDKRFATCKIMNTIVSSIEKRLEERENEPQLPPPPSANIIIPKILKNAPTERDIDNDTYKEALDHYQAKMRRLGNKMYAKRRSAVIVYEGWDAAGKGGNIKRLTSELDPRCYTVVPIGPPSSHELSRHYLWRFMTKLPKDGHLTIYDRSWYGRVLIERVDQLTPEHVWQRAYQEINEMEQHIANHGTTILKFWLHIDKEEQLRRFESRQTDPLKQYKLTEADWVNRSKWEQYETAVDQLLFHTNTPHAPWSIVESNNKKFARIKVLQTVTDALEEALK